MGAAPASLVVPACAGAPPVPAAVDPAPLDPPDVACPPLPPLVMAPAWLEPAAAEDPAVALPAPPLPAVAVTELPELDTSPITIGLEPVGPAPAPPDGVASCATLPEHAPTRIPKASSLYMITKRRSSLLVAQRLNA